MEQSVEEVVREIAELYGRKMTEGAARRWALAWAPYDAERLERAFNAVGSNTKFMPSLSELKAAVAHLYPTQMAQNVAQEWARQHGWGTVPTQHDIDNILEGWGMVAGTVTRSHLTLG